MQGMTNIPVATQGIAALLLFGMVFSANADQMLHALPAPTAAPAATQPVLLAPAKKQPGAQPPGALIAPIPQTKLAPPIPKGGTAILNPAAACNVNNTPRITNINGTQSTGIEFKPGDVLNIAGCGFGKGGHLQLSGGGYSVPLIVSAWNDANIKAQIDPALSRVPDLKNIVSVIIQPNGAPLLFSKSSYSFRAVREDVLVALSSNQGVYSDIYGAPKTISTPTSTSVTRHLDQDSRVSWYCPKVDNQISQMSDFFPVKPFANGFEAIVGYTNETDQTQWDNQGEQTVVVGSSGSAQYDAVNKGIKVTFQGHSTYAKKYLLSGGHSTCTSRYTVSLKLRGPRGMSPMTGIVQAE